MKSGLRLRFAPHPEVQAATLVEEQVLKVIPTPEAGKVEGC